MYGCCCCCRTCPTCGGTGVIPQPYARPRRVWPIPFNPPWLIEYVPGYTQVTPPVPGFTVSRGVARDMSLALT